MPSKKLWISGVILVVALAQATWGAEGRRPVDLSLKLSGAYDDNRDGATYNTESQFTTVIRPRAGVKVSVDRTDFDIYYSPSLRFRTNTRDNPDNQKASELYHDVGLDIDHRVSTRLSFEFKEFFSSTDDPAAMENDRTFRESVTYNLNRLRLAGHYEAIPERGIVSVLVDDTMKRYIDDVGYAAVGDEDSLGLAVALRYLTRSRYYLLGDVSFRDTALGSEYGADRDSQVVFAGVGAERVFGTVRARARVGADFVSYENAVEDSVLNPAADLEVSFVPMETTSIDLAVQYRTARADVSPYATQQRTSATLRARHQFGSRLTTGLSLTYAMGAYDFDTVALDRNGNPVDYSKVDGTDLLSAASVSAAYKLNRNLSVEGQVGYQDWDCDDFIRASHNRITAEIGIKTEF